MTRLDGFTRILHLNSIYFKSMLRLFCYCLSLVALHQMHTLQSNVKAEIEKKNNCFFVSILFYTVSFCNERRLRLDSDSENGEHVS